MALRPVEAFHQWWRWLPVCKRPPAAMGVLCFGGTMALDEVAVRPVVAVSQWRCAHVLTLRPVVAVSQWRCARGDAPIRGGAPPVGAPLPEALAPFGYFPLSTLQR